MTFSNRKIGILGRFLVVGLSGTVVNLAILALLATLGLPQLVAALIATEFAIINNFVWNDTWTFKRQSGLSLSIRFVRFQVVTSLTALLTLGLFVAFNEALHFYYLLAQFIAIALATLLNFSLNAKITWGALTPLQIGDAFRHPKEEECQGQ